MSNKFQSSLFDDSAPHKGGDDESPASSVQKRRPLAVRMRPRNLSEVLGQEHLIGEGSLLPKLVRTDTFGSLLFYGPPGCGKTTLAEVIAQETGAKCIRINAVMSNVAELRDILRMARYDSAHETILFIDEIHRFNKAQQDLLLPDVEAGNIRLIGATTHNPGFYIIDPLLSRSHLFRLEPLPESATVALLRRALEDDERGLGATRCTAGDAVLVGLARLCDGDMRRALNALETLVLSQPTGSEITPAELEVFARERQIRYDADEDEHYDTISAFIKSVRGSDPDAALYWLAKMIEGGEDPRFIARRLIILASEDIGLADSRALPLATAALQAVEFIGMPEAALTLSHCTLFSRPVPQEQLRDGGDFPAPGGRSRRGRFSRCPSGCATATTRSASSSATATRINIPTTAPITSRGRSTSSTRWSCTSPATTGPRPPWPNVSNAGRRSSVNVRQDRTLQPRLGVS